MLFVFECPTCKARIEADASTSGRQSYCPQCHAVVAVPESRVDAGATLGGFRLDRRLGKGGMGEVWLATQLSVGRQVAVKVLPPGFAADPDAVQRFLHEGRLAARLDHHNIVTVHEAGADNGHYYLAMAYVEGESLDRRLKRDGALAEHEALAIVRTVAEALAYAWDEFRLLHRDIKPANLMVDRRGRVFLMDLGLAKSLGEDSGLTLSGSILGTPQYMSPEQAMGSSRLTVQTDIYALGATLYHLVVGAPPFTGDSALKVLNQHVHAPLPPPRSRNPQVTEACSEVLATMMAKQPGQRYPGWREVIADLDRVLAGAAPREPAVRGGPAGTAAVSASVSKASLAHQAQAALARQHQSEAALSRRPGAPAPGQPAALPAWRSPWALVIGAAALAVMVLLGVLAVRGRSGAGRVGAERTDPTNRTDPAERALAAAAPATTPQAAVPAASAPVATPAGLPLPGVAPDAVPAAPAPTPPAVSPAAVAPAAVAPGSRPSWDRTVLPYTGDWALEFDGQDDGVTVPGLAWSEPEPLTLEAVFAPSWDGPDPSFVVGRSAGTGAMWLGVRDRHITAHRQLGDGGLLTAAVPLVRYGSVHAAGTWDGQALRLYVNGRLAATADPAVRTDSRPAAPTEAFVVGPFPGSLFQGRVEAVRVSRGARYTKDFELEQTLPLTPDADTLCLLDLEEGEGGVARDSSGHGHDGRTTGAAWRRMWPCPVPEETLREVEEALRQANPGAPGLALQVQGRPGGVKLTLAGDPGLETLAALSEVPVAELDLRNSKVSDLSPLRGAPLRKLSLTGSPVTDLGPLAGTPLKWLYIAECPVADLSPLRGLGLVWIEIGRASVTSLEPLRGMPLRGLGVVYNAIPSLEPLQGMPLERLEVWSSTRLTGLDIMRGMPVRFLGLGDVSEDGPLLDCPKLEIVVTTAPPTGAEVRAKLAGKVRFGVPVDEWIRAVHGGLARAVEREVWGEEGGGVSRPAKPPAPAASLGRGILAGRTAEALQRWREKGDELGQGLSAAQRQAVTAQLEALAGMDGQLLASLRADVGKTVELELAREKISGEIREVDTEGIRLLQTVKQGQGSAKLARTVKLAELGVAERLRRLGSGDTPELTLQRGLLALEAGRADTARRLFEKAGGPLGEALVAELARRREQAVEDAAEQAVVELLRQVSTSPKLDDKDKVVAAIRKRIGDDLKRLQAARKALAEFEKAYGDTAPGKEWAPVVQRALSYPLPGQDWTIPQPGIDFVWIASMGLWAGRYEVTDAEFRLFRPDHGGRVVAYQSPNEGRVPVVWVSLADCSAYADWLTRQERRAARLTERWEFRLPTVTEWETFAQCGDGRLFPWGKRWPPAYGNYLGEEAGSVAGVMAGYRDGFPGLCPVEQSGRNDWGLFGVGGNASERTRAGIGTSTFGGNLGASFAHFGEQSLRYDAIDAYGTDGSGSNGSTGFRLVLAPVP